jgi:hypothetical protein
MSAFVAYSDEAGVGDAKGEFLVGGYASSEAEWTWINRAWQERVLDGPPKLPYLHMIELLDRDWRANVGISFNDSEERVAEAIKVMYSSGYTSAIAAVIKVADFKQAFQRFKQQGKRAPLGVDEPDYICYLAYASLMTAEISRRYPEATRVHFVVSKKQKITHHIARFHKDMKECLEPPLVDLVGDLIPGDMDLHLPLQAADLLCWHLQRYYGPKMTRFQNGRLAMLTLDTPGRIHTWGRKELEDLAERLASHAGEGGQNH